MNREILDDNQNKSSKKNNLISNIFSPIINIFIKLCIFVYRFFKYVWYGLLWPFMLIAMGISKIILKHKEVDVDKLRRQSQKILEKERKREEREKNKQQKIDTSSYKNENIKLERKGLGYFINLALLGFIAIPKSIKKKFENIALVKQARNKKAFDTKTMLVDFSEEEEENKGKRITWEYIAIDQKGKKHKGYFDAYSRLDVQSFLLGEGLAVYSIRTSKLI